MNPTPRAERSASDLSGERYKAVESFIPRRCWELRQGVEAS